LEIILDNSNDLLNDNKSSEFEKLFERIKERLFKNTELHKDTIKYWTINDFKISKRLKK